MNTQSIVLANASPDTGNLGVTALCYSMLDGLYERIPDANFFVLDNGSGLRKDTLADVPVTRHGAWWSWRLWRPESLRQMLGLSRLSLSLNPVTRFLKDSVLLDISGGDSFTDLYGQKRFDLIHATKELALRCGAKLILMPQTYGPFASDKNRAKAEYLCKKAAGAFARDSKSFEVLKSMVGSCFDEKKHFAGIDLAFQLKTFDAAEYMSERLRTWIENRSRPVIGLNVSGLLFVDPKAQMQRYGLKTNYAELSIKLLERLLSDTDANIVLISHVFGDPRTQDSDPVACNELAARFNSDRLDVFDSSRDPRVAKGLISQLDYFAGTRMHTVIAALSSGVPVTGLAYSLKFKGVLKSVGVEDACIELRTESIESIISQVLHGYNNRQEIRERLRQAAAQIKRVGIKQLDDIAALCKA